MQDIDLIKEQIKRLFELGGEISIEIHSKKPKLHIVDASATITGVYKNLFTLQTVENGLKRVYSVQYTDLFIGKIKIKELEKATG